jgi:beta-lactamase class A
MEERTQQPSHGSRPNKDRRYRRAPRRCRRFRKFLLGAGAAVLAVALAATVYTSGEARSAAPRAAAASAPASYAGPGLSAQAVAGTRNAGLDTEISNIIDANGQYQIGVALIDLSDGAVHEYGVRQAFVAASTAKVLAAAAYYHLVETGAASLDEPMGDWTAGFQLKEMIQDSDNDSWSLIMDAVGHEELSDYAASIGVSYDPESNTLTPAEMAKVLAGLYSGTLLDPDDTAQLLSYMQDTNYETLIPAAVPAGITVFHKYGLLDGELHDAGILAKDGSSYALAVYTKGEDTGDIPQRTEIIHQLTEAVAGALF